MVPDRSKESINVLVVSSKYPPEYAGSGLRAHNTYRRLSQKYGISFDVLTSSVTFNDCRSYTCDGVSVLRIARKLGVPQASADGLDRSSGVAGLMPKPALVRINYLAEAFSVFRFLLARRGHYDLFHIFGSVAVTSTAISFARMFRVPFLVEMTSGRTSPHPSEPWIVKWLWGGRLPDFSRIVCISEWLRQICQDHGYVENVWCRPNPVDETRFFPEPERKADYRRRHTRFRDNDVVLCYIAKFMPSKNQLFLIEMARRLPERFKLIIIGPVVDSGPLASRDRRYFDQIMAAIDEHGLHERVQVVPEFVERPEEYMKSSDIYVFPSTMEGLGTPILEAIACGVPVVANRMEGITDQWIEQSQSGYVASLDPEDFAAKVVAAERIDEAALMRQSRKILEVASTEVIDQQYWELLQEARDKSPSKAAQSV